MITLLIINNKTVINLFIFLLASQCISCGAKNDIPLEKDYHINKIFNKDEIKGLKNIVYYFDNIALADSECRSIDMCYKNFLDSLSNSEEWLMLEKNIDNSNIEYKLFEKLKKRNAFNEIWKYDYVFKHSSEPVDTMIMLSMKIDGKYFKFLEAKAEKRKFLNIYVDNFRQSRDIGPIMVNYFFHEYKKVSFNKEIYRLIWAVHYITLNWKRDYNEE
jgi:hypothetical protein